MKNYINKTTASLGTLATLASPISVYAGEAPIEETAPVVINHTNDRDQATWDAACGENSTAYTFAAGDVAWNHMKSALNVQYGRDATNREISAGLEAATSYTIRQLEGILGTDAATVWDDGRIERLGGEWNSMGFMEAGKWVQRTDLTYVDEAGQLPTGYDGIRSDYMWRGDAICIDGKLSKLLETPGVEDGLIERIVERRDEALANIPVAELTPEAVDRYLATLPGRNMLEVSVGGVGQDLQPEQYRALVVEVDTRGTLHDPQGPFALTGRMSNEFRAGEFVQGFEGTQVSYEGELGLGFGGKTSQGTVSVGPAAELRVASGNFGGLKYKATELTSGVQIAGEVGSHVGPVHLDGEFLATMGFTEGQIVGYAKQPKDFTGLLGVQGEVDFAMGPLGRTRGVVGARFRHRDVYDSDEATPGVRSLDELRAMLGFDQAVSDRASLGVRAGFEVNNNGNKGALVQGQLRFR